MRIKASLTERSVRGCLRRSSVENRNHLSGQDAAGWKARAPLEPDGLPGIRIQQQFQIGFAQAELLLAVGNDARDGDGAADEVGTIGTAGDEIFADLNVPTSEREFARAEARGRDGIGDENGLLQTGDAQVVLQREEVDVDAVGDEA